jgi:general secretion pathway protein G
MLAVITIIAILTGMVIGVGRRASESARVARAKTELAAISAALETYKRMVGDYPRTDDEAQLLRALLGQRGPGSDAAVNGRALLEAGRFIVTAGAIVDPWERPYQYVYRVPVADWTNPSFVLYSSGPDGIDNHRLLAGGFADVVAPGNIDNIHANRN